jgi:hypothetical protein
MAQGNRRFKSAKVYGSRYVVIGQMVYDCTARWTGRVLEIVQFHGSPTVSLKLEGHSGYVPAPDCEVI